MELQTKLMAAFALNADIHDLPADTIDQLKKHLLDSIGSLVYSLTQPTPQKLINQIRSIGEGGNCRVPILGNIAADRAAQLYTALIRYPDFMDNYLGKEATCHPSDNIGPLLAAAQVQNTRGGAFLLIMAVAYQIQCRLIEEIPVMIKGFDHTLLLAYAMTASLCRMFRLTEEQSAHALGITGNVVNCLVTCRASYTYEWKGLASAQVALNCMNIVLMAQQGITGPISIFEGPKGFTEEFGMKLDYDWSKEDFSLIKKCMLKRFNAEVHTQSALEAALELKKENPFAIEDIEEIDITTFLTAYHIVGGGAYGDRYTVHSKEQADHSMPYVMAATLIGDELYPEQLLPEQINEERVQQLLKKVKVHTLIPFHKPVQLVGVLDPYTEAYPDKLMSKVSIKLRNGKTFSKEKEDYCGFYTRPMSWDDIKDKFRRLTNNLSSYKQSQIIDTITHFENRNVSELIDLLCN